MAKGIGKKQIGRNITFSLTAQVVSLLVGCMIYLIVPKVISELNYAYWQTFVLYANYVYLANFGILDGILLRYSSFDLDELDKPTMRSQFKILLLLNCATSFLMIIVALLLTGRVTKTILILLALVLVTRNAFTYSSYSFQTTNRIKEYAIIVIIQRVSFGLFFAALMLLHVDNYIFYCVAEIMGDVAGFLISVFFNRGLYLGKSLTRKQAWKEFRDNTSAGLMILIANLASSFLIGGARMVVQWHWTPLVFGKVSLAVSIANMFLIFISAISVALFPSLKRIEENKLPTLYNGIRKTISPVMFLILLLYFPAAFLLTLWLPAYAISMKYLGIILPFIVFTSRINLLTNNYLKAYRMERHIFVVNIVSIAAAFFLFCFFAFVIENLLALLITLVAAVMFQSILLEAKVMKIIQMKFYKDIVIEGAITILFIICTQLVGLLYGFLFYLIGFAVYSLLYCKEWKTIINQLGAKSDIDIN